MKPATRGLVFLGIALLVALPAVGAAAAPVTLGSLLTELIDRDALARWPATAYTAHQASSYDRARVAPDKPGWFSNNDSSQYIRTELHAGRQERVMMDADGPGAIVRFWLTTGDPKGAHLRLYIDGSEQPTIVWNSYDLFDSDAKPGQPLLSRHPPPLGHGGSTWYLPIPYARHCKVTLEESNAHSKEPRYYQIDYRTYAGGTAVETFNYASFDADRPLIDRVNAALAKPPAPTTTGERTLSALLAPGQEQSLDLPPGPMAIHRLALLLGANLSAAEREQAMRSVVLSVAFDDQPQRTWCPVGDFFRSGAGGRPINGWSGSVDAAGNAECWWTMPYRSGGRLTLQNLGTRPVAFRLVVGTAPWAWDERSMYFHASWHQQVQIPARPFRDWNFLSVTGRGVLVGDVMSVFNPLPSWYGEGDEKIWVDGERFPCEIGTGVEDYYDASWGPNPVFQQPFASHPRIDGPQAQGQNVYTRTRSLDAVPFTRSLRFDFEIETWQDCKLDYAATTFWYGSPGARSNRAPEPDEARRPLATVGGIIGTSGEK